MTFSVETEALRTYSRALSTWSGDTSVASSYVSAHTHLEWSDAMMFQPVVQVNDQVVSALNTALARIKSVTEGSGLEVAAAATMYDDTDAGVESNLDRTYEAVETAPGRDYASNSHPSVDTVPERR